MIHRKKEKIMFVFFFHLLPIHCLPHLNHIEYSIVKIFIEILFNTG